MGPSYWLYPFYFMGRASESGNNRIIFGHVLHRFLTQRCILRTGLDQSLTRLLDYHRGYILDTYLLSCKCVACLCVSSGLFSWRRTALIRWQSMIILSTPTTGCWWQDQCLSVAQVWEKLCVLVSMHLHFGAVCVKSMLVIRFMPPIQIHYLIIYACVWVCTIFDVCKEK